MTSTTRSRRSRSWIDGIKKLSAALHDAMELHVVIDDLIAEGDRVVARISWT